jgi:signal transduction histidine kinase
MRIQERVDGSVMRRVSRILVVEDDCMVARDLSETLSELGYAVIGSVGSGEAAIAMTRQCEPSLVVMDIELSGVLDGIQAAEQILLEHAVPTVYLTAHSDDLTLHRAACAEPFGFVVKPFKPDELRCAIELALRTSETVARKRGTQRWMTAGLEEQARKVSAQLELQRSKGIRQLESTNAELTTLIQAVADGLRAPARRINGFCRTLAEDQAERLGFDGVGHLQRIRVTSKRMVQLIDGLDRLARVMQCDLNPGPVDLSGMARTITDGLKMAHSGRRVEVAIQADVWVNGDSKQLQIVLEDLFENAWKFTATTATAKIEFASVEADGLRVCSIRDNGVGFDASQAPGLFGLFGRFHAPGRFEGIGVGLAIAQRILHRHGGRIWAESAVGRGATFYFTL